MGAIYLTARPYAFAQVVGQEHVKDVLLKALEGDTVGHAYLFSGPRGVGKTTTARLLAMAVNCEVGGAGERPCGSCESCTLVRRNSHPDVVELDAASNNSVDDIRDLREKVRLSSIRGGKRVWVLDEAHMLSKAAANALLKTLEEPPPGLIFVLATTEPERLPPTILSRCQHFRFRRLAEAEIASKLSTLCEQAQVPAESEALALIARSADGAMRDAESLLERLVHSREGVTLARAEDALGLPPKARMHELARSLAARDLAGALRLAADMYRDGFAPRSLAEQLKVALRDALYTRFGRGSELELDLNEEALLRAIHVLDDEDERFTRRGDLFALEVTVIKALNAITESVPAREEARPAPEAAGYVPPVSQQEPAPTEASAASWRRPGAPGARPAPQDAERTGSKESTERPGKASWHAVLARATPQLKAFLMPAAAEVDGNQLRLRYGDTHRFHYEQLRRRREELGTLAKSVFGSEVEIDLQGPGGGAPKK